MPRDSASAAGLDGRWRMDSAASIDDVDASDPDAAARNMVHGNVRDVNPGH